MWSAHSWYIPAAVSIFGEDEVTCESAADPVWGILWSQTGAGGTDIQRCPGGITDATGTHMCTDTKICP